MPDNISSPLPVPCSAGVRPKQFQERCTDGLASTGFWVLTEFIVSPTPRGLRAAGRRLWSGLLDDYVLNESATAVLAEAAHTVDLLADLRQEVAATPSVIDSAQGVRVHPLIVEIRQQRLPLWRIWSPRWVCPRSWPTTTRGPRMPTRLRRNRNRRTGRPARASADATRPTTEANDHSGTNDTGEGQ